MNYILRFFCIFTLLFSFPFYQAQAELLSASVGIPVATVFNDNNFDSDGMPKGILLHAKVPILTGIGIEKYQQDIKSNNVKGTVDVQMLDLFYLLPIPIINISLGVGFGNSSVEGDVQTTKAATLAQGYLQVGLTVFGIIDIHASVHQLSSIDKGTLEVGNVEFDYDPKGTMTAIGMTVAF